MKTKLSVLVLYYHLIEMELVLAVTYLPILHDTTIIHALTIMGQ